MRSLSKQFPGINIIGEEGDDDGEASGVITTEIDESILTKQCPSQLVDVTENQVVTCLFEYFISI